MPAKKRTKALCRRVGSREMIVRTFHLRSQDFPSEESFITHLSEEKCIPVS